jgi:hypothetical protein
MPPVPSRKRAGSTEPYRWTIAFPTSIGSQIVDEVLTKGGSAADIIRAAAIKQLIADGVITVDNAASRTRRR